MENMTWRSYCRSQLSNLFVILNYKIATAHIVTWSLLVIRISVNTNISDKSEWFEIFLLQWSLSWYGMVLQHPIEILLSVARSARTMYHLCWNELSELLLGVLLSPHSGKSAYMMLSVFSEVDSKSLIQMSRCKWGVPRFQNSITPNQHHILWKCFTSQLHAITPFSAQTL